NAWFTGSLIYLFFVPLGLGIAYYLIPKIMGRPIHSSQLSYYGFWGLAIFGGWTGVQKFMGGPLPSWMPAVSASAVIFMLIPILIVTVNQLMTVKKDPSVINSSPTLKFTSAGVMFLILFCILSALGSFLSIGKYTQISFTSMGSQILAVYGFFSMIFFGAIYFIVPRITGSEWGNLRGIQTHLVISMYSIVSLMVIHFFGGVWQAGAYAKFDAPLENAIASAKPYAIGASVVWIFILISVLRFSMNLLSLLFRTGRREISSNIVGRNKGIA
ncbi:MAG: cbb3-type cytochrome c oxidase subunit I, partial [Verrucomicrobiota bacterium]|nr:cbb3-type cytochrome c oxidase subunit I [Verrucomicrobiota bacterium]